VLAVRVVGLVAILAGTVFALPAAAYGANWTIQPTLGPAGPAESALTSVSCVSAGACMAVGTSDGGHANNEFGNELVNVGSFSESWDGSAWTVVPTAGSAGPNPGLSAVSCASAVYCVAVGQTHSGGSNGVINKFGFGASRALIEVWKDTTWTVQPQPGAALAGSALFGVSCSSTSFCLAVGQTGNGAVAEIWNGSGWSLQHMASAARHGTVPLAVSCLSASSCTAVGWYNANNGQGITIGVPLAERWNGRRWSVERPPSQGLYGPQLTSVSCVSRSFCLATGTYANGNGTIVGSPFAERFDGSRWTPARTGLARYGVLYGVSCLLSTYCQGAGQYDPRAVPAPGTPEPLAESWNGARWERSALPQVAAPSLPNGDLDGTNPALLAISCVSQIGCTSVGDQAVGSLSVPLAQSVAGAPAAAPPEPPAPVFGRSADVKTVSGAVSIELPGTQSFVPLSSVSSVPVGTTIDATNGTVQLTSAADSRGHTQTGQFYSGIFRFTQTTARSKLHGGRQVGITVLALAGGSPTGCGATGARAEATATRTARRLWGNAHGSFRTQGRYASATVRGTNWLTEDTCGGTLVKVVRGVISVDDLPHHRTVLVRAPHSFLAHPGPGG
jgi:hypothetical protein